jgi:dihydrofolate reductase
LTATAGGLASGDTLLFGRVTYEMMAAFWPTPDAAKYDPLVAEEMNKADKIVFSRTLKKAAWNNSIITQLADQGLIDEYQIMLDPVAIGGGSAIFKGLKTNLT